MSGEQPPRAGAAKRHAAGQRLLPAAFAWALIAYAAALFIGMWAYAALRIQSDYRDTRDEQRNYLRNVASALEGQVEAMIGDGVGAALAAANELATTPGIDAASDEQLSQTLKNMLTGGLYVRSLFIATPERYARMGRGGLPQRSQPPPSWMAPMWSVQHAGAWVGAPIPDPDRKDALVVPVARRVALGRARNDVWAGALFAFTLLDDLYLRFAPDAGGIGLVSQDGTLLMRATRSDALAPEGQSVTQSEVFQLHANAPEMGVIDGLGPFTGKPTTFAYNRLDAYPILVVAARQHEAMFAGWEARRREILAVTAALSVVLVVMTWILHRALQSLRRREMDYRTLFNKTAFGALVLEGDRVIEANDTARSMFGVPPELDLRGMAPWEFSPERQPDGRLSSELVQENILRALASGVAQFEWTHKRFDTGERVATEVEITSLQSRERTLTLAVVHDISARKLEQARREQAMAELRELAGTLVRLQDEERRRIGRDLHDTTGQALAALEVKLARAANIEQLKGAARTLLTECVELARQCSTEIRTASYLMHPPLLDEIGLLSALRWLADGLRHRSGIDVRLELPDTMDRLDRDHELAIFRVAQEALTNVHRHSMSRTAVVRLFSADDRLVLEVEDEGRGIAQDEISTGEICSPRMGVGLAGMRERVRQLGGTLTVRSDSSGTCVRAEFVMAPAASAKELAVS